MIPILRAPVEIAIEIFSHLEFSDLKKVPLVCRRFQRIMQSSQSTIIRSIGRRTMHAYDDCVRALRARQAPPSALPYYCTRESAYRNIPDAGFFRGLDAQYITLSDLEPLLYLERLAEFWQVYMKRPEMDELEWFAAYREMEHPEMDELEWSAAYREMEDDARWTERINGQCFRAIYRMLVWGYVFAPRVYEEPLVGIAERFWPAGIEEKELPFVVDGVVIGGLEESVLEMVRRYPVYDMQDTERRLGHARTLFKGFLDWITDDGERRFWREERLKGKDGWLEERVEREVEDDPTEQEDLIRRYKDRNSPKTAEEAAMKEVLLLHTIWAYMYENFHERSMVYPRNVIDLTPPDDAWQLYTRDTPFLAYAPLPFKTYYSHDGVSGSGGYSKANAVCAPGAREKAILYLFPWRTRDTRYMNGVEGCPRVPTAFEVINVGLERFGKRFGIYDEEEGQGNEGMSDRERRYRRAGGAFWFGAGFAVRDL